MEGYVDYFERADKILSYKQLSEQKYSPSTSPGVYGWFFDDLPPYVPTTGCSVHREGLVSKKNWILLYIGKASNLSERILHEHFDGALVRGKAMSSLRQSLGCLLCKELNIYLWKYPDFPKREYTFGSRGEKKLTKWMKKHTRVAYVRTEHTEELEKEAINYYTLPLNTEGNTHFFPDPLKQLKKDLRNCAKFYGANAPKKDVKKAYKKFVKQCKALGIKK